MKKLFKLLGAVSLIVCFSTLPAASQIKVNIALGGVFNLSQAGYDYAYSWTQWGETAQFTDTVDSAGLFGLNFGFGVNVIPNLEIAGSLDYLMKKVLTTTVTLDLPNPYRWNDIAQATTTGESNFQEMIINFGLYFHPIVGGQTDPYFGGGISYISAKIDLLSEVYYRASFYWPSLRYASFEITEIEQETSSFNKLGFHFKGGINIELSKMIGLFAEGQYILAKALIPHPLGEELEAGEEVEINLGGICFKFGFRLFF